MTNQFSSELGLATLGSIELGGALTQPPIARPRSSFAVGAHQPSFAVGAHQPSFNNPNPTP